MIILNDYLFKPKLFYINNTLDVNKIQKIQTSITESRDKIKDKYGISKTRTVIYCARFIKDRKPHLLLDLIELMKDPNQILQL